MNKRTVMGLICSIIAIIAALVGYGIYLNVSSENDIAKHILYGSSSKLQGIKIKQINMAGESTYTNTRLHSDKMEDAVARGNGVVLKLFVKEHQQVVEGQPLMQIDTDDLQLQIAEAEDNLARIQSNVERCENSYKRYQSLLEQDAVSLERYETAKADYLSAISESKAMQRKISQLELKKEKMLVRAPMDGEVYNIYKHVGDYVNHGTPLAMVGDFKELTMNLVLPDETIKNWRNMKYGHTYMTVDTPLINDNNIYGGRLAANNSGQEQEFSISVLEVSPPLEEKAAYRTVTLAVDNSSGILEPRVYKQLKLHSESSIKGILLPAEAVVLKGHGDAWVYVWNQNQQVERRNIVVGERTENMYAVYGGLFEGDVVIINGGEGLQEGSTVDVEILEENEQP